MSRPCASSSTSARRKPASIDIASGGLGTMPHLAIELLREARRRQAASRALSRRRAGAAGSPGGPGRRRCSARPALLGRLCQGRQVARPGGRRPASRAVAARGADHATRRPRRLSRRLLGRPVRAQGDACAGPRPHARRDSGCARHARDVKKLWAEQGGRVDLESRADFTRFVAEDTERWSAVIKAADIHAGVRLRSRRRRSPGSSGR